MEGWISLYKKFVNWEWYQDTNVKSVFIHLLLLASYEDKKWQGRVVKRGQVIISSGNLASDLKLTRQQVRTALKKLQSTDEISVESTNKYLVITIEKYSDYQSALQNNNHQTTNKTTIEATNKITEESIEAKDIQKISRNKVTNKITNKITTSNKLNTKLNYTKLNLLFLYLINKENQFENISLADKQNIQTILKRLDLYIENYSCIPDKKLTELKIQYWTIAQLYCSPYRIYIDNLNIKNFNFRFLKTKEYCSYQDEKELVKFIGYFIKSLREEIKNETNRR
jgi:hypothetical protein|nr:MAG TPA: replisome organizer [Caudoviricetes sp.]